MQKATRSVLLMSVAAVFALGQLTGCAVEPAAPEAAEAPVAEDASALLAQADEAFQAGQLERARELYSQLMEQWAQTLQPEQRQTVGTRLGRIQSMLHQRSLEEGEAEAAEHPAPAEEAAAEEAPSRMAEEEPPQPAEQPAPEAGEEEKEPPAEPEPEPIPEISMGQVPAVLGRVESLAAEGQFDQLAPQLLALDRLRDEFSAERKLRFDRLRLEVERASDAVPELPKREKVRRAEQHLAIGREAYGEMDYVRAAPHLELAAAYDVSLGWWDNRKLRNARSDVEAGLQNLKAALEAGRAAYKAGRWPEARRSLQEVAETEIVLPEELHAEVQQMMRQIEREESEEAARQLAAAQKEAEQLEARARKINDIYSKTQTRLAEAAGAMELGNYEEAEPLLTEAQQMLQDPVAQEAPALAQTRTIVKDRLAEVRRLAEQKVQRETVSRQMQELFGQAAGLVESDLPAAQQKVRQAETLAAQHQTALTEAQRRIRQRVLEALESEYGLERALVRQESLRLLQAVEQYEARGEHGRALKLVSLVRGADPVLLAENVQQQAEAAAAELRPRATGQQATARQLVAMYNQPARLAAQGETQAAIQMRDEILARAQEAGLAGEPMLQLARRDMEFVRDQLAPTIETAGPDYKELAAEQARIARQKLDLVMARYYLERSPQMAAPFLEAVGERGGETGAWARSALDTLKQRQEAADQDELLAVQDQLAAVRAAAERLHELTAQGQMEAAGRAEQELADARLTLRMEKAEFALSRGDWERADRMLEAAPADDASEELVAERFEPLCASVSGALSAAAELRAAQQALAEGDVSGATARLRAAGADAELVQPLATEREILADAIAPLRQGEAVQQELAAVKERLSVDARRRVDALEERQQGWERYYSGLQALFAGSLEEARTHLSEVAAGVDGVRPDESAAAVAVLDEMAQADRPAVEQAQAGLAKARGLVEDGAYAQAADALQSLRQMAGYELDHQIRQSAQELRRAVERAEAAAERLYWQAVEAREAQDPAEVRRLLERLKAGYSGTAFYRERL